MGYLTLRLFLLFLIILSFISPIYAQENQVSKIVDDNLQINYKENKRKTENNFSTTILIPIICACAGACVGGVVTYYASKKLQTVKDKETNCRLLCLLLSEIKGHQASLDRFIEYILPVWLIRDKFCEGNNLLNLLDSELELNLEESLPYLKVTYFNKFFDKLIYSDLLVHLASYYYSIEKLNDFKRYLIENKNKKVDNYEVFDYTRDCINIFITSTSMMIEIHNTKNIIKFFTNTLHSIIKDFNEMQPRYRYLLELLNLKYRELRSFDQYKQMENKDEIIGKDLKIPTLIRDDKNEIWKIYYNQATEILSKFTGHHA